MQTKIINIAGSRFKYGMKAMDSYQSLPGKHNQKDIIWGFSG